MFNKIKLLLKAYGCGLFADMKDANFSRPIFCFMISLGEFFTVNFSACRFN